MTFFSRFQRASAIGRLPFALILAFWAWGAATAHAVNAVITFTNFPAVVSNTYNGVITLKINGLTNGVSSVLVQKYLDANTNGFIDTADLLVQQFQLTNGQASVFTNLNTSAPVTVTNFLPGDMTSVTGQITAPLNFQNGDFAQTMVAHYLYKVSSPSGLFSPVTNLFVVTNTFFSTCVTGAVQNGTSALLTNIPNAIVLLCTAQQNGLLTVQSGTVANNSGYYSIYAPPGSYFFAAAKTNFVDNLQGVTLNANQTNVLYILLTNATLSITGRVVDATTGIGLPGVSGIAISSNNLFSVYFTGTNGNFSAPITGTNMWQTLNDPFAVEFQGYLPEGPPIYNISNQVVKVTNSLNRATAIFYGVVSNSSAAPLPGVYLYGNDNADHQTFGQSAQNGQYVELAGTNQWSMGVLATNNPGLTSPYVVSPFNVQTNITIAGDAIQQNFTLTYSPYTISGEVEDIKGNPIVGVQVFAISTNYQAFYVYTTNNGTYSINVSPGRTWTVGVSTNSLASLGYDNFPTNQTVVVSDSSVSGINFYILICGEVQVLTTNLPNGMVGDYYNTSLEAESCQNITNWTTAYGITLTPLFQTATNTIPPGAIIYSGSQQLAVNETFFSFGLLDNNNVTTSYLTNCTADVTLQSGHYIFANVTATITVSAPIYKAGSISFNGSGDSWSVQPTTNGPPYTTVVELGTIQINPNYQSIQAYSILTNWLLTSSSSSTSNTVGKVLGALSSIGSGNSLDVASTIPYTSSNNAVVWIQNSAGTNQYLISAYGSQQANALPPGVVLYPDGTLAGTPTSTTTNDTFNFTVAAEDASSDVAVQPLSLFVYPLTTISSGTNSSAQTGGMVLSSNVFPLQINGVVAGQNYTVLMATNILSTNWVPIFTTNTVNTNALAIPDANATNPARFYRVMVTP